MKEFNEIHEDLLDDLFRMSNKLAYHEAVDGVYVILRVKTDDRITYIYDCMPSYKVFFRMIIGKLRFGYHYCIDRVRKMVFEGNRGKGT